MGDKKMTFPLWLLALDIVGATLVAGGFYMLSADQPGIAGWGYMMAGFLLMIPMVLHILQPANKK